MSIRSVSSHFFTMPHFESLSQMKSQEVKRIILNFLFVRNPRLPLSIESNDDTPSCSRQGRACARGAGGRPALGCSPARCSRGSARPARRTSGPHAGAPPALTPGDAAASPMEPQPRPDRPTQTPAQNFKDGSPVDEEPNDNDSQQYVAADSASPSAGTKTFVPCKVCGDKASGYHYGVTSCEGCKGFFRRSIQKQIEYRCLRDGKCLVIRLNRNRCQFCRFKKCLAVGMSRDSVRYGRVPKRNREKGMEEAVGESGPGSVPAVAPVCEEPNELVTAITAAHRHYCAPVEEMTRGLQRRPLPPASPVPSLPASPATPSSPGATSGDSERIWLWQQLAARVTPGVQRVVEFAKRIPGFQDLGQDDQLILIKMGFFEIWVAQTARCATDSMITCDDGVYITCQQLETIYDPPFTSSVLKFMSNLNALFTSDSEIALFSAAVLVTPDRPGITDVKAVQFHQNQIIVALKAQVNFRQTGSVDVNIDILLSELRAIGARHTTILNWFRANWVHLRLPPLFAELFDIPKCDEDLQ